MYDWSGAPTSHAVISRSRRLSTQTPDLHAALRRVADEDWSHVILDGKLFAADRLAETTTSVKGDTIDAWYSGTHHDFGANIQAIIGPDGLPTWTSDAAPGHLHDRTCATALARPHLCDRTCAHRHDITGVL